MRCDGSNRVTIVCHDGRTVEGVPVDQRHAWLDHDPRNHILDPGERKPR